MKKHCFKIKQIPAFAGMTNKRAVNDIKGVDTVPTICYSHRVKLYQQECWYRLQKKIAYNNLYEDLV